MIKQPKWFWFQGIGAALALAPSFLYLSWYLLFTDNVESMTPYIQYVLVACSALLVGFLLLRKGMQAEERDRIKTLIREVLQETSEEREVGSLMAMAINSMSRTNGKTPKSTVSKEVSYPAEAQ